MRRGRRHDHAARPRARCASTPAARRSSPRRSSRRLKAHPEVFDALVVGVPDERWGQTRRRGRPAPRGPRRRRRSTTSTPTAGPSIAGYKVPRAAAPGRRDRALPQRQARLPVGQPDGEDRARRRLAPPRIRRHRRRYTFAETLTRGVGPGHLGWLPRPSRVDPTGGGRTAPAPTRTERPMTIEPLVASRLAGCRPRCPVAAHDHHHRHRASSAACSPSGCAGPAT